MHSTRYDVLIIGGGQAGVPLAHRLADDGHTVGLAERKHLGGSCVNYGCTPTKAAIASARVAHQARRAAEFGIRIPEIHVDFPHVLARAREISSASRDGIADGFAESNNPALIEGHARFTGRSENGFTVEIADDVVEANRVIIDTGARTNVPPVVGIHDIDYLHAGNWLDHDELPGHLVVVGGGYIGLEMSQFYRRMGSEVTLIHRSEQLVPHEDADIAQSIREVLTAEGIDVQLDTSAQRVGQRDGRILTEIETSDGSKSRIASSHLFVATGRRPNTDDLGLENVGVETPNGGFIEVDECLSTSVEGIFAAGDATNGAMFTHTAWDDHRVLYSQLSGDGSKTSERVVPYAIFTDPELGRVGMTERRARDTYEHVKVARMKMNRNGKATEIGETQGFIKVIAMPGTDEIIGAAVFARDGAELVHCYVDIMNAGAPYTDILRAVHIHPTLSEAVQSVLNSFST